jgi:hypothetical protein
VLFFLSAIAEARQVHSHPLAATYPRLFPPDPVNPSNTRPLKLFATRSPYWFHQPSGLLSQADLNIQNVLSYKDGATQLFTWINDHLGSTPALDWFANAPSHIRNVYNIKYSKKKAAVFESQTNSVLYQLVNYAYLSQISDADEEYRKALDEAQTVMKQKWKLFGWPVDVPSYAVFAVRTIATDTNIELDQPASDMAATQTASAMVTSVTNQLKSMSVQAPPDPATSSGTKTYWQTMDTTTRAARQAAHKLKLDAKRGF